MNRSGRRVIATMLVAGTMLAGCAEGNSIYHNRPLTAGQARVITLDAKQRNLIFAPVEVATTVNGTTTTRKSWRSCAEAAPDVFSALSASASLEASIMDKSGRAAAAIAENAGTIERTQTVNLLRESMFRTCERYLSGALTEAQFIVQAARDQRSMVAVLAIEQLTRTARPPATILAAGGTSASAGSGESSAALIKDFGKQKADAKTALDTAESSYKTALDKGKCEAVVTAPAGDDPPADPKLTDWTNCNAAKAERGKRADEYKAASDRLDKVIAVAMQASPANAATAAGSNNAGGGGEVPNAEALKQVAKSVEAIATSPGIDEALMFCIAYLSAPPPGTDTAVRDTCVAQLKLRSEVDEARRANIFGVRLDGQIFNYTPMPRATLEDPSMPFLEAYFDSRVKTEADRRMALAIKVAKALNMPAEPIALNNFVLFGATADERALLLAALRRAETDAAARALLGN